MLKRLLYLLYFFGIVVCNSCNKEKLKSPTASFIVVNNVGVSTNASQGSNSHKITDIWLYVDQKFQGAFPVGNVMPIVASGDADIIMYAGIKNNGISYTRIPYPFYAPISFNQTLEAGKTYTVNPSFLYQSGLHFTTDDFESTGTHYVSTGDSAYSISHDPSQTYNGSGGSLFMGMSDAKPMAKMASSTPIIFPLGGANVYLELNYKCNQQVNVGVMGYNGFDDYERPAVTLTKTEEWNKIYIQLTNVLNTQPTYQSYKIYIKAQKQVSNPEIYIDNVKLIVP